MENVKGEAQVVNKEAAKVLASELSKSKKMIALYGMEMEIKDIAVLMGVRYNFVYNVVSNHCNITGIAMKTVAKEGKKDQIIDMYLAGKSNKEISIDLKTNYNYVFNTIKAYKLANPVDARIVEAAKAEAKAE